MKKMFTSFNNQTKTVQETIDEFLNTKRGKRADETAKYYEERLRGFYAYLQAEGITEVHGVTRAVIQYAL